MLVFAASRFSSLWPEYFSNIAIESPAVLCLPHERKRKRSGCCAGPQYAQLFESNSETWGAVCLEACFYRETSPSVNFVKTYFFHNFIPRKMNPRGLSRVLTSRNSFPIFCYHICELPKLGTSIGQRRTGSIFYREEPRKQRSTETALTSNVHVLHRCIGFPRYSFRHFLSSCFAERDWLLNKRGVRHGAPDAALWGFLGRRYSRRWKYSWVRSVLQHRPRSENGRTPPYRAKTRDVLGAGHASLSEPPREVPQTLQWAVYMRGARGDETEPKRTTTLDQASAQPLQHEV